MAILKLERERERDRERERERERESNISFFVTLHHVKIKLKGKYFGKMEHVNLSYDSSKFDAYRSCPNGDITSFFYSSDIT